MTWRGATPTCVPAPVALFTGKSPDLHGRYGYREGMPVPDEVDGKDLRAASHGRHWIRSERHKYLWFSGDGHEQLFDLGSDPRDEHDLAGDPSAAAELARHRALLVAELEGREECFVADGELGAGDPTLVGAGRDQRVSRAGSLLR